MVFAFDCRLSRRVSVALLLCLYLGVTTTAARAQDREAEREASVQNEIDALRARLGIATAVSALIVEVNPLLVSVAPPTDPAGTYRIAFERRFLATLDAGELRAAVAHELGHVWIYTHHPYLQTERLANDVALRVVSRASLERIYAKVWERGSAKGDLTHFLGQ